MKPSVVITKNESCKLLLTVKNAPVAFPNALRRCILADVPTFAIEKVGVLENTVSHPCIWDLVKYWTADWYSFPVFPFPFPPLKSVLPDELIAHRLCLCPLTSSEPGYYQDRNRCHCEGATCSLCSVYMHIDITCHEGRRQVTSNDIESEDSTISPVRETPNDAGVPITVLTKGQRFAVKMKAAKGTGREHAKWMPCGPISWEYDDVTSTDDDTTTLMEVELNGSLSGKDVLKSAGGILQGKLLRIARDAAKMEGAKN